MDNKKIKEKVQAMSLKTWIESILVALILAVVIKTFLFNTVYIMGDSMNPTLREGDRLISNILPLYFNHIERGDIVLIKAPDLLNEDDGKKYIKRVIALEGDKVEISQGQVYVNDQALGEDYLLDGSYTYSYGIEEWIIPQGEIFLLGDNRQDGASKDSRFFGTIPKSYVEGISRFRFFPLDSRFGKI